MSRRPSQWLLLVLLPIMMTAVLMAGCESTRGTSARDEPPARSSGEVVQEPQAPENAEGEPANGITALEAVNLVLGLHPGGAVVGIERDHERGREVWEVVIKHADATASELDIDVQTGDVLKEKAAKVPSEARTALPRISIEQAIVIALEVIPGTIHEIEIDTERGRTVWDAVVETDHNRMFVHIDAQSGDVVAQGIED